MKIEITYCGVDMVVEGVYTPGEEAKTSGPPEDCYEGSDSTFDIEDVEVGGVSIFEMLECMTIAPVRGAKGPLVMSLDDLADEVCEKIECDGPDEDDFNARWRYSGHGN